MSQRKGRPDKQKNWEHSRYRDWRPTYHDDGEVNRRRSDIYDPRGYDRRRGSFFGFLIRFCIWVALFFVVIGPGFDFANGLAKAAPGSCVIRTVVDGDTVVLQCPDAGLQTVDVAGYIAPDLFMPSCLASAPAAAMAALEIRRALIGAERIFIAPRRATPVPIAPEEPSDGEAEVSVEAGETPDATPEAAPAVSAGNSGPVTIRVDGQDLASVLLASGRVKTAEAVASGESWCP